MPESHSAVTTQRHVYRMRPPELEFVAEAEPEPEIEVEDEDEQDGAIEVVAEPDAPAETAAGGEG